MVEDVGDGVATDMVFWSNTPRYQNIRPTTWKALEREGLITCTYFHAGPHFSKLTARGWYEALRSTDAFEEPAFKAKLGTFSKALKDLVKGRAQDTIMHLNELVPKTGLTRGFVYNAIDSNLIELVFERVGAQWFRDSDRGYLVRIPLDYGIEL